MTCSYHLFSIVLFIATTTFSSSLNCTIANYTPNATTVVSNILLPISVVLDGQNNLYVAHSSYFVTRHTIGSNASGPGIVIAPLSNQRGSSLSQLEFVTALFLDSQTSSVYIADDSSPNTRVLRWSVFGATAGSVFAGAQGLGSGLNQLSQTYGLHLHNNGDLYISDTANHRILKWQAGALSGVLVAGSGTWGSALNQLYTPRGICMDRIGDLYIADTNNHRIVRWTPGAATGVLVAGGQGQGTSNTQLNNPTTLLIDSYGNVFVMDQGNRRIQQFTPGNPSGVTVFDGTLNGQLGSFVYSMAMDVSGNIYVADYLNNRIQMIPVISVSVCQGNH